MIFDWQTAERLQCSREDKAQIMELINLLVQASEKARSDGLLALEDEMDHYEQPLLKLGMQLVVDGTDPNIVDQMLTARILSENKHGKAFLEQIIIFTAVLSIQSGDNPRLMLEKCISYLGDAADELRARYRTLPGGRRAERGRWLIEREASRGRRRVGTRTTLLATCLPDFDLSKPLHPDVAFNTFGGNP